MNRHSCPSGGAVFGFDATAVRLDYGLGDRESQSGTSLLARSGFIHAVEALEYVRQVFIGNAGSVVFSPNVQLTGLGGCGEDYSPPGRAVLGGVVHQDENGLFDPCRVRPEVFFAAQVGLERRSAPSGQGLGPSL